MTHYFVVLLVGSTCFGHYYAHHQKLTTMMLITTLVVSFLVCCMLEIRCCQVGVVSVLQAAACSPVTTPAKVVLQPADRTPLQPVQSCLGVARVMSEQQVTNYSVPVIFEPSCILCTNFNVLNNPPLFLYRFY